MKRKNKKSTEKYKKSTLLFIITAVTLAVLVGAMYKPQRLQILATATLPALPETGNWVNQGLAISEGQEGEWDRYLWGGFANSLIKKDGVYYLYYQGSRAYSDTCDDNEYRQIGVATSTDGINWTKYSANPVISWVDQGVVTEGAVSSGAVLGNDGYIYVYYGANSAYSGCLVHASGRVARSSDGINFEDLGEVIPNMAPLWGAGDEIFPVGAYQNGSAWNVFYIPNGVLQTKKLAVVTGTNPTTFDLTTSRGVNNSLAAWGSVSVASDGLTAYAFVNDPGKNQPIKAYSFSPISPSTLTLRKTYVFSDCFQGSVLFDVDFNRWLMLCREKTNSQYYRVKTAISLTPSASPTSSASPAFSPAASSIPTTSSKPGQASPSPRLSGTK